MSKKNKKKIYNNFEDFFKNTQNDIIFDYNKYENFRDFMLKTWPLIPHKFKTDFYNKFTVKDFSERTFYSKHELFKEEMKKGIIYKPNSSFEKTKSYFQIVNSFEQIDGKKEYEVCTEDPNLFESKDYAYKILNINKNDFTITSMQRSVWNSKQNVKNYSFKFKIKPIDEVKVEEIDFEDIFKKYSKQYRIPIIKQLKKTQQDENLMIEIPLMDLHFNKLSILNTNYEEYNTDISSQRINKVFDNVIQKYNYIDNFVIQIGQDFFNIDNIFKTTTKGTPQDTENPYEKMFLDAIDLMINNINKLLTIAKNIKIIFVPGNHDRITSWHLVLILKTWFKDYNNIIFDIDITNKRKYVVWGKVLIGFSHGEQEKTNIEHLMQSEVYELWGKSKYREWHLGHYHKNMVYEKLGLIIRTLPAMSGTDEYHYNSGYVNSSQSCHLFLWHKDEGLKQIEFINFN